MATSDPDKRHFLQGRRPSLRKPLKVGRHTKLTPEISKKITDAVRAGNAVSVAAKYSGVSEYTLHDWMSRGRGENPERPPTKAFVQFVHDVEEAQAAAEVAAVLHWRSAMPKDWHAAKDWLRVTQPDRWDIDRDKIGPVTAIQLNVGGQTGTNAPNVHEMPLVSLIEDSPAFLKAVMPLFDAVDDVYGPNDANNAENALRSTESAQTTPESPLMLQNGHFDAENAQDGTESAQDAVFDPETGSWRVIDAESDENDQNDAD